MSPLARTGHPPRPRACSARGIFNPLSMFIRADTIPVERSGADMRRRDFLGVASGAAVALPLAARAQQPMRRIGVLMNQSADDAESKTRTAALLGRVQQLGWID